MTPTQQNMKISKIVVPAREKPESCIKCNQRRVPCPHVFDSILRTDGLPKDCPIVEQRTASNCANVTGCNDYEADQCNPGKCKKYKDEK